MSLNLGNTVGDAAKILRGNPAWEQLRDGFAQLVTEKMHQALDATVENRVEATAYARALRDVWVGLEAATTDTNPRLVAKPKLKVS